MGLGSGIRDPGSGKNLFRIPDPGVKKAPDPGSATLLKMLVLNILLVRKDMKKCHSEHSFGFNFWCGIESI
jgi:hypothetical protein